MGDMGYLCRSILASTFHLYGHKTSLGGEIYGSPHFSAVSAFSQLRDPLGRLLSVFPDSHLPPAQNDLYARVAYSTTLQLPP